jgi:2-polyprenyl-3-methyl-5-hydroxy-6-metoxy-1,4-benzoquinol methylase
MDKNTEIRSPLTKGNVELLFEIPTSQIVERYKKELNIDISYLIGGANKVKVFECEDTGYRFFYPFEISGDGKFYEKLELIPWYYSDWKWENEVAIQYIQEKLKVLDIGCGTGKFIEVLKRSKNCDCTGLELNSRAKIVANNKGLNVKNETIQIHATNSSNQYDVVTFFQVLEHISNVDDFLKSAVDVTKTGGLIIMAVPNNEPYFLKYDKFHLLNLPPHHMGWWNETSIKKLSDLYNLSIVSIKKQPLRHYSDYARLLLTEKYRLPRRIVRFLLPFFKVYCYLNKNRIVGANIIAIFNKN